MSRSLEPGVVLGDEAGIALVGGVELLDGLAVGLAGLGERGAGLGELGVLLGLVLDVVGQEHRQVPALDQQPGHLHQGLAGQRVVGLGLDEAFELVAGLFEQLPAADQVAGLRRLVDQGTALLVVEHDLEVGRQRGIGAELVDVIEGQVVAARVRELLEELLSRPRILGPRPSPRVERDGQPQEGETDLCETRRDMRELLRSLDARPARRLDPAAGLTPPHGTRSTACEMLTQL